ncbi:MAG: T9SS type A sorting domain-containing protein, partial [Calditrichaeota bacterium]|nr:T9SS type A sorting domain-containing protein [Calditrichota bacterium]
TVLDVNVAVAVPEDYYLSQNYPNPFNSTTRIDFGMPETGDVSVRLFDITGRLVTELVNSTVNAGNHTLVWDANSSPAGIYMLQMSTDAGFKSIRKIMLVK